MRHLRIPIRRPVVVLALCLVWACAGCTSKEEARKYPAPPGAYPISEAGGTPATGPFERRNHCERIWCPMHGENFFIDHFAAGHDGLIVHDEERGDLFVLHETVKYGAGSHWRHSALRLCGDHVHPWVMGKKGGTPVRDGGYELALGYDKAHFKTYGTRLHPCCINGLGSGFVHSNLEQRFPFGQLEAYRAHPERGWQKPFAARLTPKPR